MVENKSSLFGIIAIIIGASGLGLGAFSFVNFQVVEGPQGLPGEDGEDAPGGIIIGIMDPDEGETISGNIVIRAMIAGSEDYTISILRNGTEIGTALPMTWNTTLVADGWWNITVIAKEISTNIQNSDSVFVYVDNTPNFWVSQTYGVVVDNDLGFNDWSGYFDINETEITFDISEGESIHIEFSCNSYLYAHPLGGRVTNDAGVMINFYLDGVHIEHPRAMAYIRGWDSEYENAHSQIYLQEIFQDLDVGPHTIKMRYSKLGYRVTLYDTILYAEII